MKTYIILIALILTSCTQSRKPASQGNDLQELIEVFHARVKKPITSLAECSEVLPSHYKKLFALDWNEVGLSEYHVRDLERIIGLSFEIRLVMKEQMTSLGVAEGEAYTCFKEARNVFRGLRYLEDYLIEHLEQRSNSKIAAQDYKTLEGRSPFFLVNKKYNFRDHNDLKSGDVILSRGNAYTSAAIARIGDIDAQFSHLSMVYKDDDGKLHTAEAHIEIGSVSKEIQAHLNQSNARSVVLRFKGDADLAHRAAKHIYERVRNHSNTGKNIQYDFGMEYKDHSKLFCTEIVYEGYEIASNGELDIPTNKTRFNPKLLRFLKQIGIAVNESNIDEFLTFSPGDTEFDHNFDIVAEWRNPAKMADSRQKDAVLTKMMEWMENENYYFRPSFKMGAQAYMGFALRRVPLLNSGLRGKFPLNMKPKQLKLFVVLEDVAEVLQQELVTREASLGRPMTFREMFETLDEFRKVDEEAFEKRSKDAKFHRLFRRID